MFKILVATDGSACADKAADYAALLASKVGDAEITVLSVVDTVVIAQATSNPSAMSASVVDELEQVASQAARDTGQRLSWKGSTIRTRVERGVPASVICDIAEKDKFDLIVMGARGHGRIADILVGSVSDKVLHKARVPVLLVRTKEDRVA